MFDNYVSRQGERRVHVFTLMRCTKYQKYHMVPWFIQVTEAQTSWPSQSVAYVDFSSPSWRCSTMNMPLAISLALSLSPSLSISLPYAVI